MGNYDKTIVRLMGDTEPPKYGYRPIDVDRRVSTLLETEEKMSTLSKHFKQQPVSVNIIGVVHTIKKLEKDNELVRDKLSSVYTQLKDILYEN